MKTLAILSFIFFSASALSQDVDVKGHIRSDGTYVPPHTRSAPDSYKWNNYGRPGNDLQEQQYDMRDYDRDNIYNQYDYDDDNDGILDDYEN
jgi:hypothetical protein